MSKRKVKNRQHALDRGKNRLGFNKKQLHQLIKEAHFAGLTYDHLPQGKVRDFIESKNATKQVKLYKGIVFVFNKTSTSCITLYPLPKELLEDENEI